MTKKMTKSNTFTSDFSEFDAIRSQLTDPNEVPPRKMVPQYQDIPLFNKFFDNPNTPSINGLIPYLKKHYAWNYIPHEPRNDDCYILANLDRLISTGVFDESVFKTPGSRRLGTKKVSSLVEALFTEMAGLQYNVSREAFCANVIVGCNYVKEFILNYQTLYFPNENIEFDSLSYRFYLDYLVALGDSTSSFSGYRGRDMLSYYIYESQNFSTSSYRQDNPIYSEIINMFDDSKSHLSYGDLAIEMILELPYLGGKIVEAYLRSSDGNTSNS